MKSAILCLALTLCASAAYAGQGTIEETDEAVIVEYSGDETDKAGEMPVAPPRWAPRGLPTTPVPAPPAPPAPASEPAQEPASEPAQEPASEPVPVESEPPAEATGTSDPTRLVTPVQRRESGRARQRLPRQPAPQMNDNPGEASSD